MEEGVEYICEETGITDLEIVSFHDLEIFVSPYRIGQIICEEDYLRKYGDSAETIINFFRGHLRGCENCQRVYDSHKVPQLDRETQRVDELKAKRMKQIADSN